MVAPVSREGTSWCKGRSANLADVSAQNVTLTENGLTGLVGGVIGSFLRRHERNDEQQHEVGGMHTQVGWALGSHLG